MTPAEITAIGTALSLVIGAVFTGIMHLRAIKYTDQKTAEVSPAEAPSSERSQQ